MSGRLSYSQGASGFDAIFGDPMREFVPTLLRLARIQPSQKVLDVASGTGTAAQEALKLVGSTGHVTAVDKEPAMLKLARRRLRGFGNSTIVAGNVGDLKFPDESFDAVLCCMALHIFSDRERALTEMRRVLRTGGRVAASVNTTPEKSRTGGLRKLLMRYLPPERAAAIREYWKHHYGLGQPDQLRTLLSAAGFDYIETEIESRSFSYPSFDVYFAPFEGGGGSWGAEYAGLPPHVRELVRDERCRELGGDKGGPVSVDVEIAFCAGTKLTWTGHG